MAEKNPRVIGPTYFERNKQNTATLHMHACLLGNNYLSVEDFEMQTCQYAASIHKTFIKSFKKKMFKDS